ncbi:MAG: hypothetical protein U1F29_03965 [Planctomycetota bacterium]
MAIVIPGKSTCAACGDVLETASGIVGFAPFVANRLDPLYRFGDAAFHRSCLERDSLGAAALRRQAEILARSGPGNRECVVCRSQISDPDEYFGCSFLTDDPTEAAFEFNYTQFHRSCFARWDRSAAFRAALERFLGSDRWDGPELAFDPMPAWRGRRFS